VTEDIVRSFRKLGFAVADGPESAKTNIAVSTRVHPQWTIPRAIRKDTFYLNTPIWLLLRTHTPPRIANQRNSNAPVVNIVAQAGLVVTAYDATLQSRGFQRIGVWPGRHVLLAT